MARRDKKKRWHEEITRRNVSSLSYGHTKSHIPTISDKDVADRFLYRMIFFFFPVGLWHILYKGLHGLVACKAKVVVELGGVVVAVF